MLPILLSHGSDIKSILEIIFSKMLIGIVSGLVIDFFFRKEKSEDHIHELCEEEHCDCEHGLFLSSFKHTIHTFFFIMIVSLFLNIIMFYGGEEYLKGIFHKNSLFSPVLASLIGLIPNCGASVVLTELYLNGVLSFSSVVAGLLTGSGVAFVVLFRTNKNVRENIKILCMVYLIGVISGFVLELFMFLV
jgi:hypothetical protein